MKRAGIGNAWGRPSKQPSSDTILTLVLQNLEFWSRLLLTFDSDDWQNTKTVTLTAVNDVIDDGDISGAFLVSIFSTLDNGYNAIDGLSIPVQVNDNDVAGFILSPSTGAMQLNEGESSQGSLALATQPTANVG